MSQRLGLKAAGLSEDIRFLTKTWFPTLFFVAGLTAAEFPEPILLPPAPEILQSLRKEHPRLFANADQFRALKKRAAAEKIVRAFKSNQKGTHM